MCFLLISFGHIYTAITIIMCPLSAVHRAANISPLLLLLKILSFYPCTLLQILVNTSVNDINNS